MSRHIPNPSKLLRILENHEKQKDPNDPFAFSMDESVRIRQLVAESLATFFAKLNDLPDPGPQPIPEGTPGMVEKRPKKRRKR